jgi:tetratricopeptide (TPR) repeat protein
LQAEEGAGTPVDPRIAALVTMICLPSATSQARQPQIDTLYNQAQRFFSEMGDAWCRAHLELNRAMQLRQLDQPGLRATIRALFQHALALLEALPDLWGVSRALNFLGTLAWEQGDYDAALSFGQRSLELYQELGDRLGTAYAFCTVGQVFSTRGHYALGQSYYQDGLAIYRELGNSQELAAGLDSLGYVTWLLGDLDEAEACYRESLALSRSLNDKSGTAWSLHNLGDIARARRDYEQARQLYEESQALHFADNPQSWGRIAALIKLGQIELLLQNREMAWEYHYQAWQLALQTGRPREALDALWALFQVVQGSVGSSSATHCQALRIWLYLVCHHPGTAEDTRRDAGVARDALSADPDPACPVQPPELAQWLTLPLAEWATLPMLDRQHWVP